MMTKLIHQIWFDFNTNTNKQELSDKQELSVLRDFIHTTCPNYVYKLWSFEESQDFIQLYYPEYSAFIRCNTNRPIIKCDFFRYLLLYHFGGVYMDLDFAVIRNLDGFIENTQDIVFAKESYNCIEYHNTLHNGFMYAAKPRYAIFKDMCDTIVKQDVANISEQDVYFLTGTKLLCAFWRKYKEKDNTESITILPFHTVCSHWFVNPSTNNKLLFDGHNEKETVLNAKANQWDFLTIDDVKKNEVELIKNGAYAVCIIMNHGSYWK
jgi:mannosyltransferase OCH1-like enzyme